MGTCIVIAIGILSTALFLVSLYIAFRTITIFCLGNPVKGKIKSYYVAPGLRTFFNGYRFYENVDYKINGSQKTVRVEANGFIRPLNANRNVIVYQDEGRTWEDLSWHMLFVLFSSVIPIGFLRSYIQFDLPDVLFIIFFLAVPCAFLPLFSRLFYGIRKFGLSKHMARSLRIFRIVRMRQKRRKADYFSYKKLLALRGQNISAKEARDFASDLEWIGSTGWISVFILFHYL